MSLALVKAKLVNEHMLAFARKRQFDLNASSKSRRRVNSRTGSVDTGSDSVPAADSADDVDAGRSDVFMSADRTLDRGVIAGERLRIRGDK